MNIHDLQLHFSIRKLSVGVVSCLIGICFISSNQTVQADSMPIASNNKSVIISNSSSNPTETIASKSNNKQDIVDSNNTSQTQINSHSNQNLTKSNSTETIASKSNNKQDIVDSNNTSQTQNSRHLSQDSTRTVLVNSKSNVSSQQPATTDSASQQSAADSAKNKLKMATLKTTTDEKLNTKMLAESKATTMQATDTNGGFDSIWGKLDVNDWQGSVQGDYYQLTDYTGDANHIIVPNEADFAKAGISTSGKQVGVTSDLMHTIFRDKTTAQNATVAFSKTDNKLVKAIGSDWSNTWGSQNFRDAKLNKFDGTNLDVSNVTNMNHMFSGNHISNLSPLANWNISNVTNMNEMFSDNHISDLSPLANWKVNNVTDMNHMFSGNYISNLSPLANWKVNNVTDMNHMFSGNHISNLSPLANWNVDNVTNMSYMFDENHISDLSPLANWKVNNVTNMYSMFHSDHISDLNPLANWNVDNVTNMNGMFADNQISDLSPLANWKVNNVTDMGNMFSNNQISNLNPLANWNISNVTIMNDMFRSNYISDLSPLANWNISNVTNMSYMFDDNQISNLNPLANWNISNVTIMNNMFQSNYISDLSPLSSWKTDNVTDMSYMFYDNQISDLSPLSGWKTDNVTDMGCMFDGNSSIPTQAKRVINFVYPAGYTGKKQHSVTQTIDVPQKVRIELTTKDSKPSNNILDWVTKTETPISTPTDPVYFQDYTVPEIKGLLEPDQTVISGQQADITKPINVTVTYKLVVSNTNDAFALDSKHELHEHANVNDNGGYDADYWGKINVDDWDYTTNGNVITITGYKGNNPSSLIIPNGADFGFINGQDTSNSYVRVSSDVMRNLAKNATRIGFSKTANNKVVASDAIWQDAFGGGKYGSPNLTQMDLHNLDTTNITNMNAMFNGGSNLTTIGDVSQWDTSNVTNMSRMFANATRLTDIGDLGNWDTSKVTDMSWMFGTNSSKQSHLTHIGNLSKWQTGKVTDMSYMFSNATSLTDIGDLGNWDTSKVTDMSWMFGTGSSKQSHLTNIGNLSKWNTSNVTNMYGMFENATSLTDIGDLGNWDTKKVTNMSWMFENATSLTHIGDLSKWNTSNVTTMYSMFSNATSLTHIGNLSKWQTGNVTDMSYMFENATRLTDIGDLSKWQTGKVTGMCGMFENATRLTDIGDLSKWQTGKVTDMSHMFENATSLTHIGNLSKWQTGKVTDMSYMFSNATSLTDIGDLGNWDTSNVTDMSWMFGTDSSKQSHLTNIGNLSKWDTSNVTNMSYMFSNAKALRHLNISNWDLTKLDTMKRMFVYDTDLTVIANNLKLPAWYQNEVNNANSFWSNHMAVITNVPDLIKSIGCVNDLKIDDQSASRSIFYDSKGSSDAIQVLKDANQAYINKYEQDHPKYSLALVDQTDPIALANAKFKTIHKIIDFVQTNHATRTIIVHLPNGTMQTIVQTIGLKRNAQKDLVTDEIINSTAPWGLDEANSSFTINGVKQTQTAYKQNSNIITFSSIKLPKVPGYKAKVTRNNGLLMVNYLVFAPEKLEANNNLSELQFSNKLATNSAVQFNSTVKSNIVVKSDMYQVVNDDHNWQLPVIKSYDLKFATNKNQIIFAYTKDKQYNYRFVLTFKDGQYRLATFDKQNKLLKTYSIKSYNELAKIIHSLVLINIA